VVSSSSVLSLGLVTDWHLFVGAELDLASTSLNTVLTIIILIISTVLRVLDSFRKQSGESPALPTMVADMSRRSASANNTRAKIASLTAVCYKQAPNTMLTRKLTR
jgi:hypothetical protein